MLHDPVVSEYESRSCDRHLGLWEVRLGIEGSLILSGGPARRAGEHRRGARRNDIIEDGACRLDPNRSAIILKKRASSEVLGIYLDDNQRISVPLV